MSTDNEIKEQEMTKGQMWTVLSVLILWFVSGIIAFITSLVCFGRSGSLAQHVIGLLLAVFFGPFYFIYFFAVTGYCARL